MKYATIPALHEHVAMRVMFNRFNQEIVELPEINSEMLQWGEAHSPEYACLPFKLFLGFFKDLAEKGNNDIFVHGSCSQRTCRYVDLWEGIKKILVDNGYPNFKIHYWGGTGVWDSFRQLGVILQTKSIPRLIMGVFIFAKALEATDILNDLANKLRPKEKQRGAVDFWLEKHLKELGKSKYWGQIEKIVKKAREEAEKIEIQDIKTIKIILAGDLFKIHEPFLHFDSIRKLNRLGAQVKQPQNFSLLFMGMNKMTFFGKYIKEFKRLTEKSKKYLKTLPASYFDLGIGEIMDELEKGASGVVHFQSFGCMPDIMLKPILDRIAKDYNVPIIHFMRDAHASDVAYETRLEAFMDLIKRKNI